MVFDQNDGDGSDSSDDSDDDDDDDDDDSDDSRYDLFEARRVGSLWCGDAQRDIKFKLTVFSDFLTFMGMIFLFNWLLM